jgi:hypothetical protein
VFVPVRPEAGELGLSSPPSSTRASKIYYKQRKRSGRKHGEIALWQEDEEQALEVI